MRARPNTPMIAEAPISEPDAADSENDNMLHGGTPGTLAAGFGDGADLSTELGRDGVAQSRPKARCVMRMPTGACRRLYSLSLISLGTRSTSARG